jgi:hypothetical protein
MPKRVQELKPWHGPSVTPLYFPPNGIKGTEDRFNWMQAVQRDRRLSEQARLVLIRLAQFLNVKTNRCDPTVLKLAMMAGLGDDDSAAVMARRALKKGEELGWIRRHRRSGGRGLNQSNSYEFLIPMIITPAGLAESVKLRVVERDGRWFVGQVGNGVEICGPFKTREAAETWAREHGPGVLTELSSEQSGVQSEQSGVQTELLEGSDRTFGGFRPNSPVRHNSEGLNSEILNSEDKSQISFLSKGRSDERHRPVDSKTACQTHPAGSKNPAGCIKNPTDSESLSVGCIKNLAGSKQAPLPQKAAPPSPPDIEALSETVKGGRALLAPLLYGSRPMTLGALIQCAKLTEREVDVPGFLKCGAVYREKGEKGEDHIYPAGCKRNSDGSYDLPDLLPF